MKKNWMQMLGAVIMGALLMYNNAGCTQKKTNDTKASADTSLVESLPVTKANENKIASWDRFFGTSAPSSKKSMETNVAYAKACVEEYSKIYDTAFNAAAVKAAYTHTIGFPQKEIGLWMLQLPYKEPDYTNLFIELGVYVDPEKNEYGLTQEEIDLYKPRVGRLTVFLWPYNVTPAGVSTPLPGVKPLNFGDLQP